MRLTNENIINLLDIQEFEESHLETVKNLLGPEGWANIYPELFGDGLPEEIVFDRFAILPHSSVNYSQKYRGGGKSINTKSLDIQQNIERNGYKLKYPAAAWFEWAADDYDVITGNTRGEIVQGSPFNIPNMIVAVYKRSSDSYTKEQIQDALDSCGLRFNAIHDPAAPLSKFDVNRTVTLQIQRWYDTDGQAGCAPTLDAITNRVDYVCGEGVFQPNTRQGLILEIYNTFNPHDTVISWGTAKNSPHRVSTFMSKIRWVNTDKALYLPISSGTVSQAYSKAVALAAANPNKEIRIVLQTGTLGGSYDLNQTYENRLTTFVTKFDKIISNSCEVFFGTTNPKSSNITIYGALPALKASHSIEEGFYFNRKTSTFYQKGTDVTIEVYGEEEELEAAE